jgi:tetratricopeptide (TPR) repeat protein
MTAISAAFIQRIYPDINAHLPPVDPPQTHPLARSLRDAERGIYAPPPPDSDDYLEHLVPLLALLGETNPERLLPALPSLDRSRQINSAGVLGWYFTGLVYERAGRQGEAALAYRHALDLSGECYPAVLGLARIMDTGVVLDASVALDTGVVQDNSGVQDGDRQGAVTLLQEFLSRYPDNLAVKRQLAAAYYHNRDWSRAEPAIGEILQRNNRDGELVLMRAHIMVEQGQFLQAQTPLDLYASIDSNNRLYLFLRARVQAEGYRNRDSALNYLRALLRSYPEDDEGAVYAARLLMESARPEDQSEGRGLLDRLLEGADPSLDVLTLAVQDAIRREDYRDARRRLERLLTERRSNQDLLNAYTVERALGNNALPYARELYQRDTASDEGLSVYIAALIDAGRIDESSRLIDERLAVLSTGPVKSTYYYLRSRTRGAEDLALVDLRSSLFENPRNLQSLIGIFEIYHRRGDERRAAYYLRQALAIAPDNPTLRRYPPPVGSGGR